MKICVRIWKIVLLLFETTLSMFGHKIINTFENRADAGKHVFFNHSFIVFWSKIMAAHQFNEMHYFHFKSFFSRLFIARWHLIQSNTMNVYAIFIQYGLPLLNILVTEKCLRFCVLRVLTATDYQSELKSWAKIKFSYVQAIIWKLVAIIVCVCENWMK